MRPDPNYPRWMFHRTRPMVCVNSPEEEAALGPQWSRTPLPLAAALPEEEKPEPEPEPEEEEEPEEKEEPHPATPPVRPPLRKHAVPKTKTTKTTKTHKR